MTRRVPRRRTESVPTEEVEFMVMRYSCHDSSVVPALGKSCLMWTWLVSVGGGSNLDLKLTVETNLMGPPVVSLTLDGKCIFPPTGKERAKIKEDLTWQCKFRGTVMGIGEINRFEMRPEHGSGDEWYPATITKQREDGYFEVKALLPGTGGAPAKDVHFPAVRPECIRDAENKTQVVPELRKLQLTVPWKDPKSSTLSVEGPTGTKMITHFFARLTPPMKDLSMPIAQGKRNAPRIHLSVAQDRETIVCSVGHHVLEHFLSGQVRAGESLLEDKRGKWNLQIGPSALHTVEVERRYLMSAVLTLVLDGEVLCEAASEDLESSAETWECTFRFIGERFLDWELFEQTPAGAPLDTKGTVSRKTSYTHECVVSVPISPNVDVASARLTVDGRDFADLPGLQEVSKEPNLVLAPEALLGSYSLEAPVKIGKPPPNFFNSLMSTMGIDCSPVNVFCCGKGQGQLLQHDTVVPQTGNWDSPGLMMDAKALFPVLGDPELEEDSPVRPVSIDEQSPFLADGQKQLATSDVEMGSAKSPATEANSPGKGSPTEQTFYPRKPDVAYVGFSADGGEGAKKRKEDSPKCLGACAVQ